MSGKDRLLGVLQDIADELRCFRLEEYPDTKKKPLTVSDRDNRRHELARERNLWDKLIGSGVNKYTYMEGSK